MTSLELAAKLLPFFPGWLLKPSPYEYGEFADLVRCADGASVRVTVGKKYGWTAEGRVMFAGVTPSYRNGERLYLRSKRPEITCRVDREPEKLANEIKRRLLPAYDPYYAEAVATVRTDTENQEEIAAIANRLIAAIGSDDAKVEPGHHLYSNDIQIFNRVMSLGKISIAPRNGVHEEPEVSFDVRGIDPETAAQVLQLICEAEDRKKARASGRVRVQIEEEAVTEEMEEMEGLIDETRIVES